MTTTAVHTLQHWASHTAHMCHAQQFPCFPWSKCWNDTFGRVEVSLDVMIWLQGEFAKMPCKLGEHEWNTFQTRQVVTGHVCYTSKIRVMSCHALPEIVLQ